MSVAESVKRRDGYQCRLCNSVKALQAHHLFGQKRFPELKDDQQNLITLCHKCHSKFHRFCPNGVNTGHDFMRFLDQLYQEKGMTQARGLMKSMKGIIYELDSQVKLSDESSRETSELEKKSPQVAKEKASLDDVQERKRLLDSDGLNPIKRFSQFDLRMLEPQFQVRLTVSDANQQTLYQYRENFRFSQLQELQKHMNRFLVNPIR